MKRKLYLLFMLFNIFVVTGCTEEGELGPNIPNPDVVPDANKQKAEEALNTVSVQSEVVEDFELPIIINGVEMKYTSSSDAIVINNNKAIVTRSENDRNVVITATASYKGDTYSKTFNVKVLKYDFVNIIPEVLASLEIPTVAEESFELPVLVNGVSIEWESTNKAIEIRDGMAIVTQSEVDVKVTLIANGTYEVFEHSLSYDVLVSKIHNPIDGLLDDILIPSETTKSFDLITNKEDFIIEWESSNEQIIDIVDSQAIVNQDYYDTIVTLTATTVFESFEETKKYSIKVIGDEVSPLEGLLDDLVFPGVVEGDFEMNSICNGYNVTYSSNNDAIVFNNNIASVTRSINSDVKVYVTATITDGEFSITRVEEVVVKQKVNPIKGILDNIDFKVNVTSNFDVPTLLKGYNINYTSNNNAIRVENGVAIVERTTSDVSVILTLTVEAEGFIETKTITLLVLKVVNKLPDILEQLQLPTEVETAFDLITNQNGVTLTYISNSDSIVIEGNKAIVKKGAFNKEVEIIVTAADGYYNESRIYIINVLPKNMNDYIVGDKNDHADLMEVVSTNLFNETYYTKVSVGNTKGKSTGQDVEQSIKNVTSKYFDTTFLQTESIKVKGPIDVSFYHNAHYQNDEVNYIHSKKKAIEDNFTATNVNEVDYIKKFGVAANAYHFTGFIINENTIKSSSYEESINNVHTFKLVLDNSLSSVNVIQQIKEFGGASSATFSSIEFTFNIDNNLNVISYSEKELYTTKVSIFTANMTQTLTTTITRHGSADEMVVVPDNFLFS